MSRIADAGRSSRSIAAAIALSSALWVAACGGSSPVARSGQTFSASSSSGGAAAVARSQSSTTTAARQTSTGGAASTPGGSTAAQTGGTKAGQPHAPQHASTQTSASTSQTASAMLNAQSEAQLRRVFAKAAGEYAACLRKEGVKVPVPRTAGKGPAIDLKGVDTSSPQYKHAAAKCQPVARAALQAAVRQAKEASKR